MILGTTEVDVEAAHAEVMTEKGRRFVAFTRGVSGEHVGLPLLLALSQGYTRCGTEEGKVALWPAHPLVRERDGAPRVTSP